MLRLANLLSCPNVAGAQHVYHMPREQMAMTTCGFVPVADLDRPTGCALIWGSNPLATNKEGGSAAVCRHTSNGLNSRIRVTVVPPPHSTGTRQPGGPEFDLGPRTNWPNNSMGTRHTERGTIGSYFRVL